MVGAESKLVKIGESRIRCPVCGSEMTVEDYIYEVPRLGKIIISSGRCPRCGYKYSDVRLAETGEPRKIVYRAESPDDLNVLVVKSSSAAVLVPELGLEMLPGPASEGFVTTVEGLLERFLGALEAVCSSPDVDGEACRRARDMIERAKRGEERFTLVIVDPEGVSAVDSDRAVVMSVDKKELRELGYVVSD